MQDLQKRVETLEVGATFDATQAAVQEVQMELLRNLRDVEFDTLVWPFSV